MALPASFRSRILLHASLLSGAILSQAAVGAPPDAMLAWSESARSGSSIRYSDHDGGQWSPPTLLSESANLLMLPTLGADSRGDAWVVWVEEAGDDSKLRFRHRQGDEWTPQGAIATDTRYDLAPSLVVGADDVPTVVWSAFDGEDDDIYFARWNGEGWSEPARLNEDDAWPDILPQLSLDGEGRPVATWSGYDGDVYVKYRSRFESGAWTPEERVADTAGSAGAIAAAGGGSGLDLPAFLGAAAQVALYRRGAAQPSVRMQRAESAGKGVR